jgi:HlyD family secretion protein
VAPASQALPVPAQPVAAGRLVASGFVVARRRATVAAEVTGRIQEVLVEEGQVVKAGQLLAVLDDRVPGRELTVLRERAASARASVDAAGIDLADAQASLERDVRLAHTGFLSASAADHSRAKADGLRAQLVRAQSDARAAEADLARQQTELHQYRIRAPFGGVVLDKNAQTGEIVSPISGGGGFTRTGICTIVDMDSLELQAEINEANLGRVAVGAKADVTLDAYPGVHWAAKVVAIVPAANRDRASVRVRLAFDTPDRRVLPDLAAKLAFDQPNPR